MHRTYKFRWIGHDYPDFGLGMIEASSADDALGQLSARDEAECVAEERRKRRRKSIDRLDVSKIEAIEHIPPDPDAHDRMVRAADEMAERRRQAEREAAAVGRSTHTSSDDGDWHLGHD